MDVSQIHSNGIMIPAGKNTHTHPAIAAARRPATRITMWNSGKTTKAEAEMLTDTAAMKLEKVNAPNARNIVESRNGYPGANHAVGPVLCLNKLLNPAPCESANAMLPAS
jgi:hypothetical protein